MRAGDRRVSLVRRTPDQGARTVAVCRPTPLLKKTRTSGANVLLPIGNKKPVSGRGYAGRLRARYASTLNSAFTYEQVEQIAKEITWAAAFHGAFAGSDREKCRGASNAAVDAVLILDNAAGESSNVDEVRDRVRERLHEAFESLGELDERWYDPGFEELLGEEGSGE